MLALCLFATAFTTPSLVLPGSRAVVRVRMEEAEEAAPAPMAPSFTLESELPLNEQYAKDYLAMGQMGAYMGIREDMARAFNTADTDGDGLIDVDGLTQLLGLVQYDTSKAAEQFAAADTESKGKIRYEQWCKVRSRTTLAPRAHSIAWSREFPARARRGAEKRKLCCAGVPRCVQAGQGGRREEVLRPLLSKSSGRLWLRRVPPTSSLASRCEVWGSRGGVSAFDSVPARSSASSGGSVTWSGHGPEPDARASTQNFRMERATPLDMVARSCQKSIVI